MAVAAATLRSISKTWTFTVLDRGVNYIEGVPFRASAANLCETLRRYARGGVAV